MTKQEIKQEARRLWKSYEKELKKHGASRKFIVSEKQCYIRLNLLLLQD